MAEPELEGDFLEELGNLLVDYPDLAAKFTVARVDPDAPQAQGLRCVRWGKIPGIGWVCLEWSPKP